MERSMTKYNVLVHSYYAEWVSIEANSEEEAVEHVKNGEWDEVVSKTCVSSEVNGDFGEVEEA